MISRFLSWSGLWGGPILHLYCSFFTTDLLWIGKLSISWFCIDQTAGPSSFRAERMRCYRILSFSAAESFTLGLLDSGILFSELNTLEESSLKAGWLLPMGETSWTSICTSIKGLQLLSDFALISNCLGELSSMGWFRRLWYTFCDFESNLSTRWPSGTCNIFFCSSPSPSLNLIS